MRTSDCLPELENRTAETIDVDDIDALYEYIATDILTDEEMAADPMDLLRNATPGSSEASVRVFAHESALRERVSTKASMDGGMRETLITMRTNLLVDVGIEDPDRAFIDAQNVDGVIEVRMG